MNAYKIFLEIIYGLGLVSLIAVILFFPACFEAWIYRIVVAAWLAHFALYSYTRERNVMNIRTFLREECGRKERRSIREKIEATAVWKTILGRIEAEKPLAEEELAEIDVAVNELAPDFRKNLYRLHNLSRLEYSICLLVKLELDVRDISVLLCRSKSAISLSRKRLYTKMFGTAGDASDLDSFLMTL